MKFYLEDIFNGEFGTHLFQLNHGVDNQLIGNLHIESISKRLGPNKINLIEWLDYFSSKKNILN